MPVTCSAYQHGRAADWVGPNKALAKDLGIEGLLLPRSKASCGSAALAFQRFFQHFGRFNSFLHQKRSTFPWK